LLHPKSFIFSKLSHPENPLSFPSCRIRKTLYPHQVISSGKSFILTKFSHPENSLSSPSCCIRKILYPHQVVASGISCALAKLLQPENLLSSLGCCTRKSCLSLRTGRQAFWTLVPHGTWNFHYGA
jgi:hypothetical protein